MTTPETAATEPIPQSPALESPRNPLDTRLTFSPWFPMGVFLVILAAAGMRFANLTAYTLGKSEGEWAYRAWSLYTGKPLPGGEELPAVGPLYTILEAATFFLFGVSDAVARSSSVLLGIGLVALIFLLRPLVSRSSAMGMAALAAISPTLVFASRSVTPAMLIAFLSLLALVSLLRAGQSTPTGVAYWTGLLGFAVAGIFASGPEGISAIITLAIGLAVAAGSDSRGTAGSNAVSAGLAATVSNPTAIAALVGSFALTIVMFFSRLLSNASSLGGIFETFADWGRMVATANTTTPTQFFLYATLLYEIMAVVFAIVAIWEGPSRNDREGHILGPNLFLTWFLAALLLQSLSSGRQSGHLAMVTLPLILLGGLGIGRLIDRVTWSRLLTTRDGGILAVLFALSFGLIGVITLTARTNDPQTTGNENQAWLRVLFVLVLVVIPTTVLVARELAIPASRRVVGFCALLVVATLLGIFTVRSTTQLAYVRGDQGSELAGQGIPAPALRTFIDRTHRLSRDFSLNQSDNGSLDPSTSYGLSIVVDPTVEYPFLWYLRDFPNLQVASAASWGEADIVIAPTKDGMEDAGYVAESRTMFNRVPATFETLAFGDIFGKIFTPSDWYPAFRFLLFRDMAVAQEPQQISVGYTFELSNQMDPASGPFDLDTGQSLGPGSALGQINQPTGIAVSPDGQTIWIVDAGNKRIQRFGIDGSFIGSLSAADDPRLGLGFFDSANQGAGDIVVGEDGLVYVADTWNHRIMVLDADGTLVRELGRTGEQTDLGDSPDPTGQPGLFFGPRSVALANGEIYVVDTGNERVQVFASDGTFLRAFGGTGTEPGKLLEPVGITIGADGLVYVADTGNARLSVFTPAGEPVTQIPVPEWQGQLGQLTYVKTGPDGMIYLSSPGTNQILAWNGTAFAQVEGVDMSAPVGMAITSNNEILITSPINSEEKRVPIQLPPDFSIQTGSTPAASPSASPVASPVATPNASPIGTPEPVGVIPGWRNRA